MSCFTKAIRIASAVSVGFIYMAFCCNLYTNISRFRRIQSSSFQDGSHYPRPLLRICAALCLIFPLLTFALETRQQSSYNFDGCSQDHQNSINDDLDDMQELAKAAVGPSEASQAGNSWYKAWWGTYEQGALLNEKINTRYHKSSVWKTNKGTSRTFTCGGTANCCRAGVYT